MPFCLEEEALLLLASGDSDENIQAHIDACSACRQRLRELQQEIGLLQQLTRELGHGDTPSSRAIPLPAIGKYVVIGRIGSGGQAEVYRAMDPTLGREVAIKWGMKGHPVEREGRDLCQLKHENLVPVFELGTQDGRPYLVMEYVRGSNLEQLVCAQPLPRKASAVRAARLLLPIAQALAEVHRRGLVHLDVKPHNILVDHAGKPYLTDFGLARHYDAGGVEADRPLGGTPGFMAPEQAAGQAHRLGPRTDIFGLGAVLYRLLTGHPPFPGLEPLRIMQETAARKLDLSPLRQTGVPRPLAMICQRALAVEPERRYASADELATDLRRFLRRGALHATLARTAAVLLVVAGIGYLLRPTPAPPALPSGPHYLIHEVRRGKELYADLKSALPLRNGDRFQFRCSIPKGYRVALFWFDAAGKLQELPDPAMSPAEPFPELIHPAAGLNRVSGQPGTDLALAVGAPSHPPTYAELDALLAPDGPLPDLPENLLIWFDQDQVKVERNRGLDASEPDQLSTVQARLEKLRVQLRDHWHFLAGVAVQQRR